LLHAANPRSLAPPSELPGRRASAGYPAVRARSLERPHAAIAIPRQNRDLSACSDPRAVPPRRLSLQENVDGWRILAYKDSARVRLVSRDGRDHTRRFCDIAVAISKVSARSSVL